MFIQIHDGADKKGEVVFHRHINGVVDSCNLQSGRVLVVCMADRVIKSQKVVFVLKYFTKQPVFVFFADKDAVPLANNMKIALFDHAVSSIIIEITVHYKK